MAGATFQALLMIGQPTPPFDGLVASGTWSFSRRLYSSYVGPFYTTNAGAVDVLKDQSGGGINSDFKQLTAINRPLPTTAGPNNIACGAFDGTNDVMAVTLPLSSYITNNSGYIIASIYIDALTTNQALSYNNSSVFADFNQLIAITVRQGNILYAYNWDGSEDKATGTVVISTPYVVEWRHEGGQLYQRINGAGETSVASGNTTSLTGGLYMGARGSSALQPFSGKVFEMATFSTVPTLAQRNALVQALGAWIGASV